MADISEEHERCANPACVTATDVGASEAHELSRCAGCKRAFFCSPKCQKDTWAAHKAECKAVAKQLNNAGLGGPADCPVRIVFREKKFEECEEYLLRITGDITIPAAGDVGVAKKNTALSGCERISIGRVDAYLVDRDRLRGAFYDFMDDSTDELHEMATALFDDDACLLKEHFGTFGVEVNAGKLLYVHVVEIHKQHRGHRFGIFAMQQILAEYAKRATVVIGLPAGVAIHDKDFESRIPEEIKRCGKFEYENNKLASYWRAAGLRRVGSSKYVACVPHEYPSHACFHKVDDGDGKDEELRLPKELSALDLQMQRMVQEESLLQRTVDDIKSTLQPMIDGGASIDAANIMHVAIAQGHATRPVLETLISLGGSVNATDPNNGLAPLHVAVGRPDKAVIETLISLGADTSMVTSGGMTIVDHFGKAVRESRAFRREIGAEYTRDDETNDAAILQLITRNK